MTRATTRALGLLAAVAGAVEAYQDSGATRLAPWPPLQQQPPHDSTGIAVVAPCAIVLNHTLEGDALAAIEIYAAALAALDPGCAADAGAATLTEVILSVRDPAVPFPTLETDESFSLAIEADTATVQAATYFGLLRALETLTQLIEAGPGRQSFRIASVPWTVTERPSFPHRGLLLDPARTFIPIDQLEVTIDALLYSKMNVLHLHLTDSQAIPFAMASLPNVSRAAAFSAGEQYNASDVAHLVAYARVRGVRVVPELDSPGHARAWGLAEGYQSIVACANVPGSQYTTYCAEPPCGQFNPAAPDNLTYTVVQAALTDMTTAFPDSHIHLGYDEVNFACWEDDERARAYMTARRLDGRGLLAEYFEEQQRRLRMVAPSRKRIYWEEVAVEGLPLGAEDTVQLWSNPTALNAVLGQSQASVLISWSEHYYLDCGRGNMFGGRSWCDPYKTAVDTYTADPLAGVTAGNVSRVLGGEALLWGELVSPSALHPLTWPRAAGFGGRLWNNERVETNGTEVLLALQAHADRLSARGIPSDRVTTRSCVLDPTLCFSGQPPRQPSPPGPLAPPGPPPTPPPTQAISHHVKALVLPVTAVVVCVVAVVAFTLAMAGATVRKGRRHSMIPRRRTYAYTRPLLGDDCDTDAELVSMSPTGL
mmetsp:Transcript_20344/g.52770  ORF Transcript_20344/g.52770 Transcript_20344/m.52770 type:complete len:652 (-) Transcript_20344:140-2095(-)